MILELLENNCETMNWQMVNHYTFFTYLDDIKIVISKKVELQNKPKEKVIIKRNGLSFIYKEGRKDFFKAKGFYENAYVNAWKDTMNLGVNNYHQIL